MLFGAFVHSSYGRDTYKNWDGNGEWVAAFAPSFCPIVLSQCRVGARLYIYVIISQIHTHFPLLSTRGKTMKKNGGARYVVEFVYAEEVGSLLVGVVTMASGPTGSLLGMLSSSSFLSTRKALRSRAMSSKDGLSCGL